MGLCCPETIFGGFLNKKVTLLMEAGRERALTDLNSYVTALLDVLAFSSSCELELPVIATSPLSLNMREKDNIDHSDAVHRV